MLLANSQQIRKADQIQIDQLGLPGIVLMETAARLATEKLLSCYPERKSFWVLAGPGNNGGDGLAMARRLHLAGKEVAILLSHAPDRYQGDARINAQLLSHLPIQPKVWTKDLTLDWTRYFSAPPVLVDALLGTGIESELRGTIAEMIQAFGQLGLEGVAVDLPSGLDANTGLMINAVLPARHTLTFQLPKICHFVSPACNYCGEIHVLDIEIWPQVIDQLGIKRSVLDQAFWEKHHRPRLADTHKGSFGHVLLVGGSGQMSGAIALATMAAKTSGVGLATVFCPGACQQTVLNHVPEAMCIGVGGKERQGLAETDVSLLLDHLVGKQALVLGPGMGQTAETEAFVLALMSQLKIPLVMDADALNILSRHPQLWEQLPVPAIITPHPGEMARLLDDPQCNLSRLENAELLAQSKGPIVVLKGHHSLIALPDGRTYVNPTGNAGMASGGMGDVLSGMIGALLAQAYPAEIAAPLAVWLHGSAGDRTLARLGAESLTATDLIQDIRF